MQPAGSLLPAQKVAVLHYSESVEFI